MASNKYEREIKPKIPKIARWVSSGATNEEVARLLGIARSTFQSYLKKYPEFKAIVDGNKEIADEIVADTVFTTACGFVQAIKKPIKVKRNEEEVIEYVDEEVYIPPNTTAQIFWLKNRCPEQWNDKLTLQHGGSVGVSLEEIIKDTKGDIWK